MRLAGLGRRRRARPPRWIGQSLVLALAVGVGLGFTVARPASAGDTQSFFRVEYASPTPPEMSVAPAFRIEARLHRSAGPSDRGSLAVGVARDDGTFGPLSVSLYAPQGDDVLIGHAYTGLPLVDDPGAEPDAAAGSCAGMDLTIEVMTTAEDGSVTSLAIHAACPSIQRSYQVRIASDLPYASYRTDGVGFGNLYPGDAVTRQVTVQSTGTGPLVMSDLVVADDAWNGRPAQTPSLEYSIAGETCTAAPVPPGASCTIDLQYQPLALGVGHWATVSAQANTAAGSYRTWAGGGAQDPIVTPNGHDFGQQMESVPSAPHRFEFGVAGGGPRTFGPIEIIDGDAADFEITGDTCSSAPVLGGTTCAIDVAFVPKHVGSSRARLIVHGDAVVEWRSAVLTGSGTNPISLPPKVEFGYQAPGGRYVRSVTLTSLASGPIRLAPFTRNEWWAYRNPSALNLESETCTQAPLPPHGTCTLTFVFTPDAAAPPDTWSETSFTATGDGWYTQERIFVTGIAREPDPGSGDGSPPVIQVTPFDPSVTEGDRVVVYGTYADPRGLAVTMSASSGAMLNQGGQGWGIGPTGTWEWQTDMGDGPGILDVTLVASNADATSPPTQLHFVIANAAPTGSVEGPGLVPASGEQRLYRVWVTDAGGDLASITPTCGTGSIVSFLVNQNLVCSFTTETSTRVGLTAIDKDGARLDLLTPVVATGQVRTHADADISMDAADSGSTGGAVALVDLDGDGVREVVTGRRPATGPSTVAVLLDPPGPGMSVGDQATPPHGFAIQGPSDALGFGAVLGSAGDMNGDGIEDLLVAAPDAEPGGQMMAGSVFVVYGGGPVADLRLDDLDPAVGFRIDGRRVGSALGTSMAGGGDVNGDGFDDIVLGAPGDGGPQIPAWSTGVAYVIFGGRSLSAIDLADSPGGRWVELTAEGEGHLLFGSGLAVGDVDGDGLADVVTGGGLYDRAVFVAWGARTFQGRTMGASGGPGWTRLTGSRPPIVRLESTGLGYRLAAADVDGDGVRDVVAGYHGTDSTLATVFYGSPNRSFSRQGYVVALLNSCSPNIAAAGDMDGDGRADIAVRSVDDRTGFTTVVGGGQAADTVRVDSTERSWLRIDDSVPDHRNVPAVALGDVNGDGLADLVLGDGRSIDIFLGARDRLAPTVGTPAVALATRGMGRTRVPVRISWTASDRGSGVRDFTLSASRDEGARRTVALTAARASRGTAVPRHRYQWFVRARDWAGNRSSTVGSVRVRAVVVSETSTSIRWTGHWSRRTGTRFLDGHTRVATTKGASASFTFKGRSVAWVATRGTAYGAATIYVDGVRAGAASLHGSSANRRIVFARSWPSAGTHTIRIVVAGTRGHARVDVDGFVVLR